MYVTYHSDKFENPRVAFILGFMTIFANVFTSVTNLVMALTQKSVINVITNFIGFRILVEIQVFYMKSRDLFKIKKAVSNDLVVIVDEKQVKNKFHFVTYKILRTVYSTLYFYFFPLLIVIQPMITILTI